MSQYRIIQPNGIIRWFKLGTHLPHRQGGPAVIFDDGSEYWCIDGELHREDGPALILYTIDKVNQQWWFHGKNVPCKDQETFERLLKLKAFW